MLWSPFVPFDQVSALASSRSYLLSSAFRPTYNMTANLVRSYSLDEACLQSFPRRDLTAEEAESTRHGRALEPAGIDGVYAVTAPDGHVIALLTDEPTRTKSVVVLRPATL